MAVFRNNSPARIVHGPFRLAAAVLVLITALFFASPGPAPASHSYSEIIPPGWMEAEASDINDSGTIVGSGVDGNGDMRGFIYSRGAYKTLSPPGWERSFAQGVNNNGDAVGHGLKDKYKGFLYSKGNYTGLLPEGWQEAYAYDVNDRGAVVGYGRKGSISKGFLYDKGEYAEILPPGWKDAYAYGINNSSVVVGYGHDENNNVRGFMYDKGNFRILLPPGWTDAKAIDINDKGEVAGHGRDSVFKGFIYSSGSYREIIPPGLIFVEIFHINNRGVFAGRGLYKNGRMTGFIYDGYSYSMLLPPGWQWSQAYAVNDSGAVIGAGSYQTDNRGFVATGLPEMAVNPEIIFFSGNIKKGFEEAGVTVRNNGASALSIGTITKPDPPFSIAEDNCSGRVLGLAVTCVIKYGVGPASGRTKASTSVIPSNDPYQSAVTITLGIYPDNDGDGYTLGADCDDGDPLVNPDMTEIINNGKDDDCNEATKDN